ncbi:MULTISPECIES: 3-isopropylmalate dehydratase small subunit [unclassified Campylobacter]|uniref:3-isopropylmalate dehydratase small subunit n=1 Tax=unclassified Campylobacter TaxID=2593542 RepID=UPI0012380D38|nr:MULTISPECIES: 3-isopropylmalate dehydratase small subunit [unclassified Campylobacter]KAA6225494.1 3-isopropylmalate dehydratase small subunit [Campylobacter sp. LR196d]KAA6227432.1 3-isopropylmalate dehydratase small subunit [Campylobacter sp. LR185c]KAA6229765.1 3-isopropylmalate dehydratase small subunit [Campylobacter sp. LR286c]KAA6234290.1 3-isopropylmalate dehydratase small subunit [Campylobacter sp. LR291e]KAA6234509.1 3-isopropylmalate dehydratase small subunit [Campylobacter sp. L
MQKFITHKGIACPLNFANIDTDQIIPKQFLLSVSKIGFGKHLFHDLRYLDDKESVLNPEFKLNQEAYKGASIIVAKDNFGNGSSREHAPWALMDFGIRAIIAPRFGDIFKNNALGNGLLAVVLTEKEVDFLIESLENSDDKNIEISLIDKKVFAFGKEFNFEIDEFHQKCLLEGLDTIDLTLQYKEKIKAYENNSSVYLV